MSDSDLKLPILAAYKRLLRPLIRILIRNGISFGEFDELAREVYVEVAASSDRPGNKNEAGDRIALLTGLPRAEVDRVIAQRGKQQAAYTSNLHRTASLLSGWHTDPLFTGPYGLPLDVPFEGPGDKTFSALVKRYSGDIAASTMLEELLHAGVVAETEDGRIKVLTRTYLPSTDAPESLDRLGYAVRDFVETIDFNRQEESPNKRLLERTVRADNGVRLSDLPEFRDYVRERGQFLLEEIDDWLSKHDPAGDSEDEPIVDTGVGIFHFIKSGAGAG